MRLIFRFLLTEAPLNNLAMFFFFFQLATTFSFLPGVPSEFVVNTCNAGSATLSVNIDGPSKVKMDCRECPEGYKITYTPMAPGNYLIAIKYGGPQHIVGSPFKAKITGPPHAGLSDVIKPNVPLRKSVQVSRGR